MTIKNTRFRSRSLLIVAPLFLLTGCIVTPRMEVVEQINFNYQQFNQPVALDYNDALCTA